MFDFEVGEDLELIVETARSFATDELFPRLREHESTRSIQPAVRKAYSEMGLAGLELPESLGGAGLGALARVLVNEELAAGDAGAALALDPLGPALYPLLEVGGDEALQSFALPLLEREGARAVLVSEADAQLEVGPTLSGRVPWAPSGRVDLLVVLREDEVLVVEEGIEADELRGSGLRAAGASELRLASAPIAARWKDPAGAARARARARLYAASLLVGVMRQAAEFSRTYALEREAFGKPIAHHQGLAFLIIDMRSAVDGARLLLHEAAWRIDQGIECEAPAAMAFAEAIDASLLVGPNGVQVLGGHGFMQDYPVEKYMREARVLGLTLGGVDAAREEAGQALVADVSELSLSYAEYVEEA
ncbi:MAG: acyl-CoA/acyl-ACP dehydrogenase [Deltaproteobacteria bacterium]|nr:acyl-CoA/acyl-ACP dehydrogenase [Deltaproteobacteria bacterium]MBW2419560.1 acyl-CoA/acyl-ACP dehydrogenase [Deltaproteobacteria bacterium]